jgi:hypothetical protein
MSSPTCLQCHLKMRCRKAGFVLEVMNGANGYQKWSCDVFECPGCHAQVATSYGRHPIAEYYQQDYFALPPDGRAWDSQQDKERAASETFT